MFFSAQPITRSPIVGEILAIRSSINSSFNRGIVEEKLNNNQYRVVLFDLGTKDTVSINSFVEIPEYVKQVSYIFISLRCFKSFSIQLIIHNLVINRYT